MKHKRYITLPLLVLPALVAFGPSEVKVSFAPEEGSSVTKSFRSESEIELDDMTMVMNGQEMDAAALGMEMEVSTTLNIVVTDTYEKMGEGHPTKLMRSFDTLSMANEIAMSNSMMGDQDAELGGDSELEGTTVTFVWDEESEEFVVEFADDSGGDEALLEGLEEDMDLRGFLPGQDVSEGSSWEVDPQALRGILAPGGSVKIKAEVGDEMMGMSGPQPSPDQYIGDIEGEVTATYGGTTEVDGVAVAVIELEVSVSTANDLTDVMIELMEDAPSPEGMDIEMDVEAFDMEYTFEGKGQVLWNLKSGSFHSLELTGDVEMTMDTSMSMSMGGQDMAVEQTMTMSGSDTITASTKSEG